MVRLVWTFQASEDLEEIAKFISRDSEYNAKSFIKKIVKSTEILKAFPLSGRVVPELKRQDLREITVGPYRVIYQFETDSISILTVYHSSRIFPQE